MIKLKTLALACAMAFATPAFAQFTTGGTSHSMSGAADAENASYNMVGISYTNMTLSPKHGDDMGLNGFSFNYLRGISLSQNLPIYLEVGGKLSAGFHSESFDIYDDEYIDQTDVLVSLSVPVNFAWRFGITDKFAIKPYVGINFKVNVFGQTSMSYDDDSESYNWFDKDDMGESYNRFQFGWHIGAGFQFSKCCIGVSYGTDFSKIVKNVNTGTLDLTLSYCF